MARGYAAATMHLFFALAEAATETTDYDETLLPIALGLAVVALVYAAVATWMVTPKGDDHH